MNFRIICAVCLLILLGMGLAIGFFLFINAGERNWIVFLFATPVRLGLEGGIGTVLANTFIVVGLAILLSIAMSTASVALVLFCELSACKLVIILAEILRGFLAVGASTPRLLTGFGAAAVFGGWFGLGLSALCGILSLACILSPIMANGFLDALDQQKERILITCHTLGLKPFHAWSRYVAPAASTGIFTTLIQSVGRGMGDAAALYLTCGTSLVLLDSLNRPAATLAVYAYSLALDVAGGTENAFAAGFVLFALTAVIQAPLLYLQILKENQ